MHFLLVLFLAFVSVFLSSCEKPELTANREKPPVSTHASNSISDVSTATQSAPEMPEKVERKEPAYPMLAVFREGDTIVIEGALKSRLQKTRIAEDFGRAFPELQVDDRLLVESHRYPVGWGNRVSAAFLIPYFVQIKEPYVGYEEGVVILKGKGQRGTFKNFQELAINVFAGALLKDVHNEIQEPKVD